MSALVKEQVEPSELARSLPIDTIFIEDCLATMRRFQDQTIDVVFTSPPYNRKRNDTYSKYDDTIEDYLGFLKAFTDECLRVSPRVIVNIQSNYYNKADVYRYMGHYADQITQNIVWTKANPMPASGQNITNSYEYFFVFGQPLKSNSTYTKNHIHTGVNPATNKEHGAIMHLEVAKWFIEKFTQPGDVVYDPFMGLGTTAVACLELDRHYLGSEITKEYAVMAEQRIFKAKRTQLRLL